MSDIQHVFIIGSKGIPARYGGFESFVEKLTLNRKNKRIQYHVACSADTSENSKADFAYNNAHCFPIKVKNIGSAKAILYDLIAIRYCFSYIKKNNITHAKIYVLACRIGPFIKHYSTRIKKMGGFLFVNPDGHEWKRAKWNFFIKKYWKFSEKCMIKNSNLIICDSKNIENYIKKEYEKYSPMTTYISYGAEIKKSKLSNEDATIKEWYSKNGLSPKEYYLVVGRFVPENNYEIILREFMKSNTKKSLVLVTNIQNNSFYKKLMKRTRFDTDSRIKFVGTVYDEERLKKIRENAYGYLHGHEVGGTNPSLLEALGSTELNLLLDVGFNREVGEDGTLYWKKNEENLASLIEYTEKMNTDEITIKGNISKRRISTHYDWVEITDRYEKIFMRMGY